MVWDSSKMIVSYFIAIAARQ